MKMVVTMTVALYLPWLPWVTLYNHRQLMSSSAVYGTIKVHEPWWGVISVFEQGGPMFLNKAEIKKYIIYYYSSNLRCVDWMRTGLHV